jgi:hypothetical protein
MNYIVTCKKTTDPNEGVCFRGFGDGLPDRATAEKVYRREIKSGKWRAVYMERIDNGFLIDVKEWIGEGADKQERQEARHEESTNV